MKKILTSSFVICLISLMFFTGCGDNDKNLKGDLITDSNSTTDEAGRVKKTLLDENNYYIEYADDDTDRIYPVAMYECDSDGNILNKDFYEYNENKDNTKHIHYEGDVFDYTEVYEYDGYGNNTKIITYAGTEERENLTQTLVMAYNKNGNVIKSMAYDSDNALDNYDITKYITINGTELIKKMTCYSADGAVTDVTVYSYRKDGTTLKDVRTVYDGDDIYYKAVTDYDKDGVANNYKYYDADGNEIEDPEE